MELERSKEMIEIVMEVDDEFWNIINQLKKFKEQKEIAHCKDCKYWDETYFYHSEDDAMQRCICRKHNNIFMTADDFCSRGEKK